MNKVFQIFKEEKQEAVNETVIDIVEKSLSNGIEMVNIMNYTELTRKQLESFVNNDKFTNKQYADEVRRWLGVPKESWTFEERIQEAINETRYAKRLADQKEFAEKLLSDGFDMTLILKYTGLTRKQIEEIENILSVVE